MRCHAGSAKAIRPTLVTRVGGGFTYRPLTAEEMNPRSHSSPALGRVYSERRGRRRDQPRQESKESKQPELQLVNEECERLRAELRDRRREESRLSSRLDQLESSVFERMQLADGHDEQQSETQSRRSEAATAKQQSETHSRQSEEGRLAAFQRNVDRLMDGREHQPARSGGEETKGSTPSGTNAKSHFRHVLGPRRNEAKAQAACGSQSWRQNIDALKESERAIRRRTNAVESGKKHAGLGGDLLSESEVSELREELQKMENQCRQEESRLSAAAEEAEHGRKDAGYFQSEGNGELREEQRPSGEEERSSTSESLAEARRLADFWKKRAEEAEYRAWSMAEAMNELALVADERYVEALEKQLLLKQQLTSAEHRCEAFLEVWESVVEMSGPVQKEEGRSSLP